MEKKIYIDGREQGTVSFKKDGIYTVVEAEILSQEKLMRLYVQGCGKICPLGIMEPKGDKAVFRKRYSRIEAGKLPQKIEKAVAAAFDQSAPQISRPEKNTKSVPEKRENCTQRGIIPWVWENGNLFYVTESDKYLAFPADLRKEVPGIRLKYYKNQQYMLFRY